MAIRTNGTVLRQLQTLFDLGSIGDLTDGQLLERFTMNGDESAELAFAALVERHGPMVLRVCRNALVDPNDAQDAFQVTFLVLVRKARSLWVRDSLGPWLHRVACRVASRARASAARRRAYERRAAESRPTLTFPPDDGKDVCSILHEEIDRLPERCRVPVVLCDLEGLTHEQAARHLSWPIGTVKSRLTLGRDRLRGRLIRRGMAPTAGLLPMSSTAQLAPVSVPAGLIEATVKAARSVAAGLTTAGVVPATVQLLLKGVLTAMFMTKMRLALLACGLLATGVVVLAQQSGRGPDAEIRLVQAAATEGPKTPSHEPDAIDAQVSRDMDRLDVELLGEEVKQLRDDVQLAYQLKTQAERPNYRENPVINSHVVTPKQARSYYEALRESYRTKTRELMIATQRFETEQSRARAGGQKTAEPKPPSKKPSGEKESARSAPNPPAAVIGSIDIDAVFKRWVKAQQYNKDLQAEVNLRRGELMKIESEVQQEMELMQRLQPATADYVKREIKIAKLKATLEAAREENARELGFLRSQNMASLFQEIQEAINAVARAKGLNYVIKVSPEPKIDANPDDMTTALGRSVLYADPRNDITLEVIGDLNQRSQASGHKNSK